MNGESNLALLRQAEHELQLSIQERHNFARYFIGALSERVSDKDWLNALQTAKQCALAERMRRTA